MDGSIMKQKQAFTLIEMIIVIIIMSYFLLTSIPNLTHILNLAASKTCEGQVNVINAAILQYKMEYLSYPSTLHELVTHESLEEAQLYCDGKPIRYENNQAKTP
jgi:competence protein ComGC